MNDGGRASLLVAQAPQNAARVQHTVGPHDIALGWKGEKFCNPIQLDTGEGLPLALASARPPPALVGSS